MLMFFPMELAWGCARLRATEGLGCSRVRSVCLQSSRSARACTVGFLLVFVWRALVQLQGAGTC